ncbi:hypothetical protein DMA15_17440 [Streptomyces sp. WAC 01529]|uniref:hypothetical protein n=1 Tax=Streptomyces sp. WAC 01529 TaxID=2203205 RepID=UPI000F6F583F|nr:hypothetical protein [Streptomyces sp. WAC 01529]AZM54132.1 hypothetical protein DMA15_17440 [Streptomyces sp. WAC 01529]
MTRQPAKAWWEFSDALPDGEVLLPVQTDQGLIMAVRRGHMSEELLVELNKVLEHLIGTGRWNPGEDGGHDDDGGDGDDTP